MTLSDKLKNLALATGLVATLSNCSQGIKEGTVYDKWHEPERKWVQIVRIGKMTQSIVHYDDEDFGLKIRDYNEKNKRCETNSFYVDKDTFNKLKIGDYFIAASKK